ncbi:transmembrane protein, putative, partial [Bodo saltans]
MMPTSSTQCQAEHPPRAAADPLAVRFPAPVEPRGIGLLDPHQQRLMLLILNLTLTLRRCCLESPRVVRRRGLCRSLVSGRTTAAFSPWALDVIEEEDFQFEPLLVGGGRSEMFQHTNMMMNTLQESHLRMKECSATTAGGNRSTGSAASSTHGFGGVFSRNRWTLHFMDPVVEQEFIVFYYSSRTLSIANLSGQCLVCATSVALYSGLSLLTELLYALVCVSWVGCGIAIVVLRRTMQRYESEAARRILTDHNLQVLLPPQQRNAQFDYWPHTAGGQGGKLAAPTFEGSTASSTRSSVRMKGSKNGVGDSTTSTTAPQTRAAVAHSLLIPSDPHRIPMRRNAQIHELINCGVLVVNFLFAIANFAGKGTCYNARWDYEMELRGCRRAIQMDSVPLMMLITSTFMNHIRIPAFAAIYIICSIVNFASRTAPPMIALIPAYFWASVTVFGIEAL